MSKVRAPPLSFDSNGYAHHRRVGATNAGDRVGAAGYAEEFCGAQPESLREGAAGGRAGRREVEGPQHVSNVPLRRSCFCRLAGRSCVDVASLPRTTDVVLSFKACASMYTSRAWRRSYPAFSRSNPLGGLIGTCTAHGASRAAWGWQAWRRKGFRVADFCALLWFH